MFKSEFYDAPKIITPDDNFHYFFGYYDMRAESKGRHLSLRVPFMDKQPEADDEAEIGFIKDKVFFPIAKTTAWNFQQAAMQQWHPYLEDTVYYNAFLDDKCVTVTHNFLTGEKKYTSLPTACVSPDGKWGLSVNFARIFEFRPGYGYAGCIDENAHIDQPENDGIFLVDMESGNGKLIVSYPDLAEVGGFDKDEKVLVNHITFNTTSNKYCALLRNFIKQDGAWATSLIFGDLEGNITAVLKKTYVSHYVWQDEKHLIAHCSVDNIEGNMFRINMEDGTYEKWDMPYFHLEGNGDIHCNIINGIPYVIGDGYPKNGYRYLMAYNYETGSSRELFRCKTVIPDNNDIRCDLHARFINGGKEISFDTTMNGCRQIAVIPATALDF